jgi:hypothetical protein
MPGQQAVVDVVFLQRKILTIHSNFCWSVIVIIQIIEKMAGSFQKTREGYNLTVNA